MYDQRQILGMVLRQYPAPHSVERALYEEDDIYTITDQLEIEKGMRFFHTDSVNNKSGGSDALECDTRRLVA